MIILDDYWDETRVLIHFFYIKFGFFSNVVERFIGKGTRLFISSSQKGGHFKT
jgi:hypothetical protein